MTKNTLILFMKKFESGVHDMSNKRYPDEIKQQIFDLYLQGDIKVKDIAAKLNMTYYSVAHIIKVQCDATGETRIKRRQE